MAVMKCVTQSVFSCRLRQSIFFVKLQTFTVNGSGTVCDGICFYKVQTFTINGSHKVCDGVCFSKVSSHYYEWQCPSLWQML